MYLMRCAACRGDDSDASAASSSSAEEEELEEYLAEDADVQGIILRGFEDVPLSDSAAAAAPGADPNALDVDDLAAHTLEAVAPAVVSPARPSAPAAVPKLRNPFDEPV